MQFTASDITAMLSTTAMGETVTLQNGATTVETTALVELHDERNDPLSGGNSRQWYVLVMASSVASTIDPDWTVIVQGSRREVLECIPKGNGFTDVYLGDVLGECP